MTMHFNFKEVAVKHKSYEIGKGFRVDIELEDNVYQAYLWHPDCGIKDDIFGLTRNEDVNTFEDMLQVVKNCLEEDEYLEDYIADYMECSINDILGE